MAKYYQNEDGKKPNSHCYGVTVARMFAVGVLFLFSVLPLAVCLGYNNSGDPFPSDVPNCTNDAVLSASYYQRSVNIFCGIFLALTILATGYELFLIIAFYVKRDFITENLCLCRLYIALDAIFLSVVAMGAAGTWYIGVISGNYRDLFEDEISGTSTNTEVRAVTISLWVAFGGFVSAYGQYISVLIQQSMSAGYAGCGRAAACHPTSKTEG